MENQLVAEYVNILDLFKKKIIDIDNVFYNNQEHLNCLFRRGLSEELFVCYKKNYDSYSCNSYLRRKQITNLILVKFLYNWYSNSIS